MSSAGTLRWLADLQARFGEALRLPLDRSTGTLRADTERYPDHTVADLAASPLGARERMAVYQRQYWFRLFGVLQQEFRLTARLMGLWKFNEYASRFLEHQPPAHYDIHHAAEGFSEFLVGELDHHVRVPGSGVSPLARFDVPGDSIREASLIDQAFRQILHAPAQLPLAFTQAQAAILPRAQLIAGAHWQLVKESWPLMTLRHALAADDREHAVPLPPRKPQLQHWLIVASPRGPNAAPLPAIQARLLEALRQHPVAHALALVEQDADDAERALLLAHTQAWLADSVHRGFWIDLVVTNPR